MGLTGGLVRRMNNRKTLRLCAQPGNEGWFFVTRKVQAVRDAIDVRNLVDSEQLPESADCLDLCVIAVPNGITRKGLPLSLQVIGKSQDEPTVLRIAWAVEQATGWHLRSPPH